VKRRTFFEKAGLGSAALLSLPVLADRLEAPALAHGKSDQGEQEHGHDHGNEGEGLRGDHASATITFGQWRTDPPFDRFATPTDRTRNNHALLPSEVKIKAGGSINFVISGFHNPQVFLNRVPSDIDRTNIVPGSAPPLINDAGGRVFRGLDPRTLGGVQDRVEAITLTAPGRYLVICGVLPHFFDDATGQFVMFGFIEVED